LKGTFAHGSEDRNEAKIEVGVGILSEMVSAKDALKEKMKAAEKRNTFLKSTAPSLSKE